MKAKELRDKNANELGEMKKKLARDLMNARFKNSMGQFENPSLIKKLRRDVARINTILREKVS
ncbi:MAG TPA: 50S ribosomal protein L29 [Deltaproteobacteria bacterium]|jgi:large subunit ribosomal protein L29|nr:50S ribosomal protein L29 [Deltaproteobacteria bacterium]HOI07004.1 50S ribosomal protein L29 [Deltaproteobacteria bacterium]